MLSATPPARVELFLIPASARAKLARSVSSIVPPNESITSVNVLTSLSSSAQTRVAKPSLVNGPPLAVSTNNFKL